ncbi:transposable element Tcb2 transposase [Trichonephila clavipes]|nr:transposable element Tcb2 transposase [Trichonephila clavipes]
MDDKAQPHRTLAAVEELLESEYISRMDWAAYSPDLNPIEHVWDTLGRRIAARLHYPENTQQLKQMLIEEWALLPQEMLHQQDLSMRRRCKATIAQNMYKDTKNFVRSFLCTICLSRKNSFKIPPAPHQSAEQSQEPGETCHIDIFGPLNTTPKGSEFLECCRVMGTQKRHISNYSAHVNGRVEKPNQSH